MNSANENKHGSVSSNGEPAISRATGKINIWFAPVRPLHLQIKPAMKTALQNYPVHPALFQIAALVEIPTTSRICEFAPVVTASAFVSLRPAAAKSKTTKNKNSSDASAADSSHSQGHAMRTASPKNTVPRKSTSRSAAGLKKAEFHLIAPMRLVVVSNRLPFTVSFKEGTPQFKPSSRRLDHRLVELPGSQGAGRHGAARIFYGWAGRAQAFRRNTRRRCGLMAGTVQVQPGFFAGGKHGPVLSRLLQQDPLAAVPLFPDADALRGG
jgi:hypothetical protein